MDNSKEPSDALKCAFKKSTSKRCAFGNVLSQSQPTCNVRHIFWQRMCNKFGPLAVVAKFGKVSLNFVNFVETLRNGH